MSDCRIQMSDCFRPSRDVATLPRLKSELCHLKCQPALITGMAGLVAITRAVSRGLAACELTYQQRVPIDVDAARAQHRAYERALAAAGCRVEQLEADASMPDSVFVEDTAIVFDELALIPRPGAE